MSRPRDIHEAVDALIQRQRIRLTREDTAFHEWQTIPSLWEQLESSIMYSGGSSGSPAARSRLPISATVHDLIVAITTAASEGVMDNVGTSRRSVPDNLRAIAAKLSGGTDTEDQLDWWTSALCDWCQQARAALRLDPERPRWARGVRCPDCGADQAHARQAGETVQTPALAILWVGPDDDDHHPDTAWRVRAVECKQCGMTWFRGPGGLDMLIEQMLKYNLSGETMTGT